MFQKKQDGAFKVVLQAVSAMSARQGPSSCPPSGSECVARFDTMSNMQGPRTEREDDKQYEGCEEGMTSSARLGSPRPQLSSRRERGSASARQAQKVAAGRKGGKAAANKS